MPEFSDIYLLIIIFLRNVYELVGHFHPLLVHLPIGILLLAGLFQWLAKKEKFALLKPAIGIALFWGMWSAVASCISGYILSGSDDYDLQLVTAHKWLGISTAFISLLAYLFYKWENNFGKWIMLLMGLLIIITGHLGGSLTHGSDYLTKPFSNSDYAGKEKEKKPIPDAQEAVVYSDIIQPVFESRCYTCHNTNKKKGGLRLDQPQFILKGGKDGIVIKPGDANGSEMIKRLLLPRNHEHHMPPKEKPALKEGEITLLHWWISTGASFDKKAKELQQPETLKPILLALQKEGKKIPSDIPVSPVEKADEKAIEKLKQRGIIVLPIAQNSNYIKVNFVTVDSVTNGDVSLLLPVKRQLIWLNMSNKKITDKELTIIGQLTNLTRLQLDNTVITDKGLVSLQSLNNLEYLNLVGTKITAPGIMQLAKGSGGKNLLKLQAIYLYKTNIAGNDWVTLKNMFPKVSLDSGRYFVPILETDTTVVQPPGTKK